LDRLPVGNPAEDDQAFFDEAANVPGTERRADRSRQQYASGQCRGPDYQREPPHAKQLVEVAVQQFRAVIEIVIERRFYVSGAFALNLTFGSVNN
jgi:hypothetical protein